MKPNLVYIFADQLTAGFCGYSGSTRVRTPNVDRLAKVSASFSQAVSTYPLCGPHRACLFTGKYPSTTRHFRNDVRSLPDEDAIGHVLSRAGYKTGYIGKWHLYCRTADEQFTPPGPYRLGFDQYFASYNWNHDYWNGFYYLDDPTRIPMEGYQTDVQTDMAVRFLDKQGSDPFALFVSYEVPHPPCTEKDVPKEYYDLYRNEDFSDLLYDVDGVFRDFEPSFDKNWQKKNVIDAHQERCRTYSAMITCLDYNLGRILDLLESTNRLDNTIFVFTSDHGDMLGGHGRIEKRIFFDRSTRVPFLIRWNEVIQPGINEYNLGTPDIAPTLLDLMGIEVPESHQGYSFAPALTKKERVEDGTPKYSFLTNMHCGAFNHREEYRAVRTERYLYARMVRTGKEFLFDHRADPREEHNLSYDPEQQTTLESLRAALKETMRKLGDEAHPTEWHEEHWVRDGILVTQLEKDRLP